MSFWIVIGILVLIAIWAIATYPITEERAHEVRAELERRRGVAAPVGA